MSAWQCPVLGCSFETLQPRARSAHLLRTHHLLFRSHNRPPIPVPEDELEHRLEALRRRHRGANQRRRENARQAPPPSLIRIHDDDLGDAVIDIDLLADIDFLDDIAPVPRPPSPVPTSHVPTRVWHHEWQVVPWVAPPVPEVEILPGGIPISEFVAFVGQRAGQPSHLVIAHMIQVWGLNPEDIPRLNLSLSLVVGARRELALSLIEAISVNLQADPSGTGLLGQIVGTLCHVAAGRF